MEDKIRMAIVLYTKAIRLNPNSYETYINRGIAYKQLNEYENAIKDFKKGIELFPVDFKAFFELGLCYFRLNRYDESKISFQKAFSLNQNNFEIPFFLSSINVFEGNFEMALHEISKALAINPLFDYGIYQKAKILLFQGQTNETIEALNSLQAINSELRQKFKKEFSI